MNADAVAALLNEGVEAFRLTREYVGEDLLPPLPGWSWFDWCEKAEAALAAAPLPEPVYDFAWLIERGQPEGQVPTVWWWLAAGGREGWTEVATEAFHFESREAAEEIIAAKFTPPTSRGEASARAVEHSFIAAAPLPSEPDVSERLTDDERTRQVGSIGQRWGSDGWHVFVGAGMLKTDVAQAFVPEVAEHIARLHNVALPSDTPADGLDAAEAAQRDAEFVHVVLRVEGHGWCQFCESAKARASRMVDESQARIALALTQEPRPEEAKGER